MAARCQVVPAGAPWAQGKTTQEEQQTCWLPSSGECWWWIPGYRQAAATLSVSWCCMIQRSTGCSGLHSRRQRLQLLQQDPHHPAQQTQRARLSPQLLQDPSHLRQHQQQQPRQHHLRRTTWHGRRGSKCTPTPSWWSGCGLTRGRESSKHAGLLAALRRGNVSNNLPACAHTLLVYMQHPQTHAGSQRHLFLQPVTMVHACAWHAGLCLSACLA